MNAETIARWQFGITTVYHFFFVPVTLALSIITAILQTLWVRSGDLKYLRLTKFYGKLFLINFAMGVVTGIVQEFQFGMNWSEYSRFVGDIFGAPLALEALLAFFLESTFIGMWIFGWDRLPKKVHLTSIWLAAIGTNLSAIFILAANAWMQNPVGAIYDAALNRAHMTDFGAVLLNPVSLVTFAHVITSAWMTVGGLMVAVSGWHLAKIGNAAKNPDAGAHRFATKFGAWVLLGAGLLVCITGDIQGKIMTEVQPMKMAAAEGLYTTEGGDGKCADFSILTIGSMDGKQAVTPIIKVPCMLSFLATGNFDGKVEGINDLTKAYESGTLITPTNELQKTSYATLKAKIAALKADPNSGWDWAPNIPTSYWTFRIMMGLGFLAMAIGAFTLWTLRKGGVPKDNGLWKTIFWVAPLAPLFGISFGWIFTEIGRQPWLVNGVLPTASGVSPGVSAAEVLITCIGYTLLYGVLAVVELGLFNKYVRLGLPAVTEPKVLTDADAPLTFAY
ncbi:cytochrome ubiquinol oxidase subunit I [Propioniciclava tarda]|uniref:Cytochrome ubiquinol oxidase subunit I n=1 Tax=Propioniciclava tarda TaxID=433330 RepID=A0A4V2JSX6_PROTD|nr:cytochrome ubiquinol oxidase subunit I [Propioniciclava tarda]TBT93078.1 cytochrome ubiquinol oxidase subunit I [Propioniciclava tarda]SMO80147.1 cytochrome bd-I ubiquinol oxidase subunit 1 apoprotein [Propioniciclava tarda]HOA88508.1 cytochrome ubiquinol oxidase subunit I [Propioniciclava tarda]HQD60483.1 cytochrome ubiquinol oxidase subunit I [Propioniciclava tarda]